MNIHSNSEKYLSLKKIYMLSSYNEKYFKSLELKPSNAKIMKKKKINLVNEAEIIEKINNLESNQNLTNNKLDLILSILTCKLLGKNDFKISHYDLCLIKQNNKKIKNKKKEIEIKDDADIYIDDELEEEHISKINYEPHFNSNNLDSKILLNEKGNKSININNISSGNDNLKEMINDFLNQNEKNINENIEQNNEENIKDNEKLNKPEKLENENVNNINIDNEKEYMNKEEKIINSKVKKCSKINSIDLNKYKIETDIINKDEVDNCNVMKENIETKINNSVDNINDIINKENNNINSNFKKEKEKNNESNNNSEKDKLENININEEINNKENNEKNLNIEESQKIENSQNDSISINSNSSNSSAKKSNKSTSKKIRGFNFRNKINMKKYKGNKSERSSSPSISNND